MVRLSFLLSHIILIVFKRFWSSLSDLRRRWTCLEKNNGAICLTKTVRHFLILVIVRDYLAPPHGPAGGSGSVPNHSGGWIESFNALFWMESQWRAPDTVNFVGPSFRHLEQWRTQHEIVIIISCWIRVCFLGYEHWRHKQTLWAKPNLATKYRVWTPKSGM